MIYEFQMEATHSAVRYIADESDIALYRNTDQTEGNAASLKEAGRAGIMVTVCMGCCTSCRVRLKSELSSFYIPDFNIDQQASTKNTRPAQQ